MNMAITIIKSENTHQADQTKVDLFYLHHLNQLQGMVDAYCHTGNNNYYLEQAKKEQQECCKLKSYKF